jgi:hypothetical protein
MTHQEIKNFIEKALLEISAVDYGYVKFTTQGSQLRERI